MKNNNNRDMDQNMGLKDFSHSLCSLEITYIQIFGGRGGEGKLGGNLCEPGGRDKK